ncbi:hypothetical protein LCP963914a_9828 [Penicillium roqueforti]|nr:hypothetical protein LCP963914a_9828 [Penicillium roqueforti]
MPVAGIIGPAFEYDRARRSTAPSPEMMPTQNLNQDKGDLEYSKSDARDGGQPSLADSVDKAAEWLEQLCLSILQGEETVGSDLMTLEHF